MTQRYLDRSQLKILSLTERDSKKVIDVDHVALDATPISLSSEARALLGLVVERIRAARSHDRQVMLAFGAHTIKNGLAPVLVNLMEHGWVTHLATNGAGIIHDWEFAFQGKSSEDVRRYVAEGQFGIWEETGRCLNLALAVGAFAGLGYGESIGSFIENDGVLIPSREELREVIAGAVSSQAVDAPVAGGEAIEIEKIARAAAAADLLELLESVAQPSGAWKVPHAYKRYSVQAAAFRLGVPLTGHPMIGQDIIYTHPVNRGAVIGRTAERDFLSFANAVCGLEGGGVYLSVGSAVMSPMVFEKSLSMANNIKHQRDGNPMGDHLMVAVDLAPAAWDWAADGEPPADHPAYYLRYCKTFSRMGGEFRYLVADNRDFLCALQHALGAPEAAA